MDHLEGVLFIDHLSRLKRGMALKKLTKAKKLTLTAHDVPPLVRALAFHGHAGFRGADVGRTDRPGP